MLPQDVPLLAEIFRASIEELTGDDYSEAQQEAWAEAADDLEAFGARLAGELTLIAAGKETVLKANDSCFIGPNESREIINRGNDVVTMLVAVSTPPK